MRAPADNGGGPARTLRTGGAAVAGRDWAWGLGADQLPAPKITASGSFAS